VRQRLVGVEGRPDQISLVVDRKRESAPPKWRGSPVKVGIWKALIEER
jgi:hypothetical protein